MKQRKITIIRPFQTTSIFGATMLNYTLLDEKFKQSQTKTNISQPNTVSKRGEHPVMLDDDEPTCWPLGLGRIMCMRSF
jgi:hypothetical protein